MKLKLPPKPSSEDALAMVIDGLEVFQAVSDVIPSVPLLGTIVTSVLGFAKMLEVRYLL